MENSVTLGGTPIVIRGKFPRKGQTAPDFSLVAKDLADVTLEKFGDSRTVAVVPSPLSSRLVIFPETNPHVLLARHRFAFFHTRACAP